VTRYAIVTVVEAPSAEEAWEKVAAELGPFTYSGAPAVSDSGSLYVGDPCPVPDAEEYATRRVQLDIDGAALTVWPERIEG
jgi:hypothetical protein